MFRPYPWYWKDARVEFSTAEAIAFCRRLAFGHYENFPVVSAITDKKAADAAAAIYAFARIADDFADEEEFAPVNLELIDTWENQLSDLLQGTKPYNPVFVALKWAIKEYSLPTDELFKLLSAFRQDCTKNRYETMDELLDYCKRSADPVGRLMLAIFGIHSNKAIQHSDSICTALQLANFWQDVSVDAARNRIYIPRQVMDKFGLTERQILDGTADERFGEMMRYLLEFTFGLFRKGAPLLIEAGLPASIYLGLVWLGGVSILGMELLDASALHERRPELSVRGVRRLIHGMIRSERQSA